MLTRRASAYGVPVGEQYWLCPVPEGLQQLMNPGVNIPESLVVRLRCLEFRGGQTLSADDWARLPMQLVDEH